MRKFERCSKWNTIFFQYLGMLSVCAPLELSSYSGLREWEQWDQEDVSQMIDAYWRSSSLEREHRALLASLIRPYIQEQDRFLEVGCGSGLIYEQLVPGILPNSSYTGVDISEKMLGIAKKKFPAGNFFKGDLYDLPFPDQSFPFVAAFEVLGHIGEIEKPISEMFRVTSRQLIFTVWVGPRTKIEQEIIGNTAFLHNIFSEEDIRSAIHHALINQSYGIDSKKISEGALVFIISKTGKEK